MIKAFVENGRLVSLVIALLLVAGFGAISSLPRTEDPHITNRFASVITPYPGASAERVEALVTEVLENQLRRLEEIKLIQSTSRPGISVIQLELKDTVMETDPVWSRARDLLADAKVNLPEGIPSPTLDDQIGYAYTAILSLVWNSNSPVRVDMLNRYAKELQSRLRLLSGTDFVKLYGAPTEEMLVQLDGNKMSQLQLTPAAIAHILSGADSKIAAGEINNREFRALVEVSGELDSLTRIRQVPLKIDSQGQVIRLGDIATVTRQAKTPADSIALVDGEQGVFVAARMLNNSRVDLWQAQVNRVVDELNREMPANIQIQWLFEQNSYTSDRLGGLVVNLLQGFVIILLVLLLTLGLRNAIIVAISLPLTALFTLACMKYIGLPIHQMSVTGLVVALGIMVDNAIVIVDAISQRRQQGMSRLAAVSETIHHLWLPLAGSTITTILAFAPIVLMPGAAGEFVGGIAMSVMFALLGSYLISHTIIAGLAGRFSHEGKHDVWYQHGINLPLVSQYFQTSLRIALKRPILSALLIGITPVLGFYASGKMTEQFFPPSDRDMFQIEVYLAPHVSLDNSLNQVHLMDKKLHAVNGITQVDWVVGGNTPSFYYNLTQRQQGATNYAQAMVKVTDFERANELIPELQQQFDSAFPEAQVLVRKLEQGPPFNAPVELMIFGPNLDTLRTLGDEVRNILAQTPDVLHTRATLSAGAPKLWLQVNEDASLMSGLSLTDIAKQIQMSTTGVIGGSVLEQTESLPVRVRLGDGSREQVTRLSEIQLVTPSGESVALSALAHNEVQVSRGAIPRRNGQRVNTIEAYIVSGVLPAQVLNDVKDKVAQLALPSGYRIEIGGESAKRNEAVGNLLSNVMLVVTLLLATVVLSFNSFRLTAIILLSAIQSAGLGLLAVFVFGYPFGFPVIIGLLGLMGLAINAAIVILAELEDMPSARLGDMETIVSTVSSCGRHISSTTITTVGGFIPLIIAGGGFWPPFAIAIAGGTLLTTLLSLVWVPTMYLLLMKTRKANNQSAIPA
ncbi:MAG: efflux RND transporter permease subunit [Gammaproteobacteria bacterium]|nr:efflux RND transporter permease subunit [Gammaproteobacteria bacterium]MBU1476436.1 efflux RND transporter permease subunit [Gammaproteobacteria bacterium]MBU2003170.1 efflux RND transporter permease subunit [Gammaproteobacteria bacterium]MBU2130537.1 efflux RND transporter permease subunit [Gammaproteobacteria bacterium]MBU2187086.1 efflux RND transporter permease subunit [Gammaproteobacteria bacterium]